MGQFIQQRGSVGRPRFDFRQRRGLSDNPSEHPVTFLSDRFGNLWVTFSTFSGNDPVTFLYDISGNPAPGHFLQQLWQPPCHLSAKTGTIFPRINSIIFTTVFNIKLRTFPITLSWMRLEDTYEFQVLSSRI